MGLLAFHEFRLAPGFREAAALLMAPARAAAAGEFLAIWVLRAIGALAFAATALACLTTGRLAGRLAGRAGKGGLPSLGIGLGILGSCVVGLGLAGIAFRPLLAAVALLPAVPAAVRLASGPRWRLALPGRDSLPWLAASVLGLVAAVVAALAPETGVDPLTYHLARPLRLIALHRLSPFPGDFFGFLPPLGEGITAALTAAGGDAAVRLLNPALLAGLAALALKLAGALAPAGSALPAGALVATSPFLAGYAAQGKNDLLVAFLAVSALALLLPARNRRSGAGAGLLAGVLLGAAFTAKFTAGHSLVAALAAVIVASGRAGMGTIAGTVAGFVLAAIPHSCWAWLAAGDPLFPFGWPLFASPWLSETAVQRIRERMTVVTLQDPSLIGLKLNLKAAFGASEESLSRLAAMVPFFLLVRRPSPALRGLATAAAVLALAWFAGPPQVRFATPLFVLAGVLAAAGAAALPPAGAVVMRAAVALQIVHCLASPVLAGRLRAGLGLEPPAAFVARNLTSFAAAAAEVTARVPPGARLLSLGESRIALLSPRAECAQLTALSFPPLALVRGSRDAAGLFRKMRRRGWDWVVYNRPTAFFWGRSAADDGWTGRELALWAAFWREHAEVVWESPWQDREQGHFYLFRLVPRPRTPARAVLPGAEGWVWRMDREKAEGRERESRALMAGLRAAAGDFGITDRVEADLFGGSMTPAAKEALLARARSRGFRSPAVCLELARLSLAREDRKAAIRLVGEALTLDPGLTRPEIRRSLGLPATEGP